MPEIKPVKILSFSSEDELYPVKNLLKDSSLYQWKCKSPLESEAHVEFQFENLTRFTRIEMGNSGSAFVEMRVSRRFEKADYQVLLGSTSLMTPPEALKCESLNRVKYFKETNFSKEISFQKWDVMKLVCSQPFNKTLQYGISFIKFFGETENDSIVKENQALIPNSKIDVSKFLDVTSNETDWLPGSLFINRKKFEEPFNLNKINEEKKEKSHPVSSTFVEKKVNKNPILAQSPSGSDVNTINQTHISTQSKSVKLSDNENNQLPKLKRKHQSPDLNKSISSQPKKCKKIDSSQNSKLNNNISSKNNDGLLPSTSSDKHVTSSSNHDDDDDFEEIFQHVVFVLSGYQNPLRNSIRDKALSMGGKYRSCWTSDCTHLICAFNNTPKFKEVLGKGIIVSEKWILESFNKRKLLPWREFRLKGASSPPMKINKNANTKPIVSVNDNTNRNSDGNQISLSRKTTNSLTVSHLELNSHWLGIYNNEALIVNPDLKFVNSSWIDACDEQNLIVSTDDFEIER